MTKGMKKSRWKDNLSGYLFISPWLIGFLVFTLIPGAFCLFISFTDWDMFTDYQIVGIQNYIDLFHDDLFLKSLWVTARFVVTSVGITIILSLALALLLNINSKAMYFFRTAFYIPSVVSGIAVALVWSWIFSPDFGVINYVLSLFGISGPDWLGNPAYAPWAFLIIMCTTFVGAPMVIFLAALQNVPPHLYESASLDGAGAFAKLFYITLPEIKPIIVFNLITTVIGAFRTFTQAQTLAGTDGNPGHSLLFMVMYLYKKGFNDMKMGYASAIAWVFFIIVLVCTLVIMKFSNNNEDKGV
ncbi:carbohydrate ABC transporter permease [Massiliimalia massiliensis]|uniref:carbohydrate ABC transporter permease n=1 Tax=Massiliimalia massiliensis TaxID=1852384 RepID=UPI0009875A22|nr:sugar ABC transporter permease [Massiliimalia massiliensis]